MPASLLDAPIPARATAAPVAPEDRIVLLDVLRGFALWGVCLANLVPWLSGYTGLSTAAKQALPTWRVDRVVDALIGAFVHGRFITIFSFLFGLGFAVQLLRAEARGEDGARLVARRLGALLVIGVVHAYLVWGGDITHVYAILGTSLLVARRWPVRRLVAVGVALLLVEPIAFSAFTKLAPELTHGALSPASAYQALTTLREQRLPALFGSGAYRDIVLGNRLAHDAVHGPWVAPGWVPELVGLFLLGLATGRAGLLARLDGHTRAWRTVLWSAAAVAAIGFLPHLVIALTQAQARIPADVRGMLQVLRLLGKPATSLAYVCAIVLLFQHPAWRRALLALAPVGRMALTNYLTQSFVGIALFYGIGLGLYGKVGPTLLVALSVTLIATQAVVSRWWLARYRFGPAEWLWRTMTYGRRQPLRPVRPGEPAPPRVATAA